MQPTVKARQDKNKRGRRGNITVLTMLSIVVLLGFSGFAIDYGFMTSDANHLQRTCDAASLAAAQELKKTAVTGSVTQSVADALDTNRAYTQALTVANQNGVASSQISAINFLNNNTQVRVIANRPRAFLFGRFLGMTTGRVTRQATAGVGSVAGGQTNHVVPLGITEETYDAYRGDQVNSYEITLIRQNKDIFNRDMTDPVSPDPVVLFDLRPQNSKSGAHMQRQIEGSDVEEANIGDSETTLNASLSSQHKKMQDGFGTLFERAAQAPWNDPPGGAGNPSWQSEGTLADQIVAGTASRDNPRVVHIIVTPSTNESHNGTFDTRITNFAPVYVESVYEETVTTGSGRDRTTETVTRLRVRFLPPTNVSSGEGGFIPGAPGTQPGGVRSVGLVS